MSSKSGESEWLKPETTRKNQLRRIFLLLASTMTVMAGATIAPALPEMQKAFSSLTYAELWVKLVLSVPGLIIAICAPFVGILIDNSARKPVLLWALVFYGFCGFAGYILQDSLMAIIISRIGLGVAVAGIMVSCTTLAGDYFKGPQLGKYMGYQAASGGFGGVLFLSMAGILAEQNWSHVFFIYLFALIIIPGIYHFINEPEPSIKTEGATIKIKKAPPNSADKSKLPTCEKKTNGPLSLCYLLAALEVLVLYSLTLHLPFQIQALQLGSSIETGFLLSFLLMTMSTVSCFYGQLSQRLSVISIHLNGWALISLGLLCLSQSPVTEMILLSLFITGFGMGMIRPNLIVWLFSFTQPASRGKIIGGITTCFFLGQFVSSVITEPFVQIFGYSMLFLSIGTIGIVLVGSIASVNLMQKITHRISQH